MTEDAAPVFVHCTEATPQMDFLRSRQITGNDCGKELGPHLPSINNDKKRKGKSSIKD
jgi:hypothetical protein